MVSAPWLLHVDQISRRRNSRSPRRAVVQSDEPRTAVSLASIVTCSPCRRLRRSLVLEASADSSRRRLGGHVLCSDALRLCSPPGESAGTPAFSERLCEAKPIGSRRDSQKGGFAEGLLDGYGGNPDFDVSGDSRESPSKVFAGRSPRPSGVARSQCVDQHVARRAAPLAGGEGDSLPGEGRSPGESLRGLSSS